MAIYLGNKLYSIQPSIKQNSAPYPIPTEQKKIYMTSYAVDVLEDTWEWGPDDHRGFMITFSNGQQIFIDSENDPAFQDTVELAEDVKIQSIQYFHGCLFAGTKITMADGSEKNVEDIVVGDKVLSFNPETMELEPDEVTYADGGMQQISTTGYDIWTFDNGQQLMTVNPHRLFNIEKQKMVYLAEWEIGQHAYSILGNEAELVEHKHIDGEYMHFTIFTKNQNYFANGLLAGNRHTEQLNLGKQL